MATAEDVLRVARGEIGTVEAPKNSNRTRYGEAYGWNGVAWCVIFLWWCFREAGASGLFYDGGRTASCAALRAWAQRSGHWVTGGYRPGDLVQLDFDRDRQADHIAIVEAVLPDGTLQTIEGNTSAGNSGSQSNGGGVFRRLRGVALAVGAVRPEYEEETMDIDKLIESMTDKQLSRLAERTQAALGRRPVSRTMQGLLAEARGAGITDGTDPNAYCTRAQAAVMAMRAGKGRG